MHFNYSPLAGAWLTLTLLFGANIAVAAPDTLVVKGKDGAIAAGAAKTWKATGVTTVVFQLAEGVDGAAVAKLLTERLASAKVASAGSQLTITGIPTAALLDQLVTLSLTGNSDPLADLAGLGGAVASAETPEGGGSIRASKPTATTMALRTIKDHDPAERLEAEVLEIKQGAFPSVTLKLKVRRIAKAGPLKDTLSRGKIIEAPVAFTVGDTGVDLTLEVNKRNLASWYLAKGDRVTIHPAVAEADRIQIDWITRP